MNSTYRKLVSCDEAIREHIALSPEHGSPHYRSWFKTLDEICKVKNRVVNNVSFADYGPHLPHDVSKWQMTEQEWSGMETPGLGT